ncbi:hypothetical protein [Alienimonas chondri]|uniref:Uncharacterized protein n=1 Tax=Alienimonas chondri TaxID=2681879 RepID=A0ABX1VN11_9PLAN|nr:hypothetical protein [Alienimonas chondri]NNJ28043.1 hypothetical protein [Alienimonas chondri]
MALSARRSRPIRVCERDYRWAVRHQSFQPDASIVIQDAGGRGRKLLARLPFTDWVDQMHDTEHAARQLAAITPAVVRALIESALSAGWEPDAEGPAWRMPDEDAIAAVQVFLVAT